MVTVSDQSPPALREARRETKTCPIPRLVNTETNNIAETSAAARPTSAGSRTLAATIQKAKPRSEVTAVVPMM